MTDKSFVRMESTCLEDELDFLNAVFFEELQISDENTKENEKVLYLNLEPSTADDKTKQFVFVKLKVLIPAKYPQVPPAWTIVNSRGLSDELLAGMLSEAKQVSEMKTGHSMLYEVIEHLKVYITEQNKPSESCCVCMSDFEEMSERDPVKSYTKTDCFHYFHLACLACYIQSELDNLRLSRAEEKVAGLKQKEMELDCPVCREVIASGSQCLEDIREISPEYFYQRQTETAVYKPDEKMLEEQARRAALIEKQRLAGGIIDLDQEAAKFDVDTAWRPPTPPGSKLQTEIALETTEESVNNLEITELKEKTLDNNEEKITLTSPSELETESVNDDNFPDKTNPTVLQNSPMHQHQKPHVPRADHPDSRGRKHHNPHKNQRGTHYSPQHASRRDSDHSRRGNDYSRTSNDHRKRDYDYSSRESGYPNWKNDYSNTQYGYSGKDDYYSGRNYYYPGQDYYYSGRDYYYPGQDYYYSGRDYYYSGKDDYYSNRDYDPPRREYDDSTKQYYSQDNRQHDHSRSRSRQRNPRGRGKPRERQDQND